MKGRIRQLVLGFLLLMVVGTDRGICQSDTDFQTWLDYTRFMFISNKSAIGGDVGVRGLLSHREWTQVYIRPTFRTQFGLVDLAGGFAWFYSYYKEFADVHEFRLYQQATLHWPKTGLFKFNHRLRFEQRWLEYTTSSEVLDDEFTHRFRYQLMVRTRDLSVFRQKLYFKLATEFFRKYQTDIESFVNRNRMIVAVGHRLPGKLWYELHYMAQLSRSSEEDELQVSEHILRLRLFTSPIFKHRIE